MSTFHQCRVSIQRMNAIHHSLFYPLHLWSTAALRHRKQLTALFRRYRNESGKMVQGLYSSCSLEPSGCVRGSGIRQFVDDFPVLREQWGRDNGTLNLLVRRVSRAVAPTFRVRHSFNTVMAVFDGTTWTQQRSHRMFGIVSLGIATRFNG